MKRMLLLAGAVAAASALTAHPAAAASLAPALMQLRAATAWEHVYTTATGEQVRISGSDELVPDDVENQRWADFLASTPHGKELATVVVYLTPPREVRQLCGREALACYYDEAERIVFPSEELPGQPARTSILAHEYGHHIADSRRNTPWPALLFGTKRWATYTRVCPGVRSGRMSLEQYEISPSETFAESYRVLVERRLGLEPTPWEIIDPSFAPDDTALSLLEQDVLDPWSGNTAVQVRGSRTRSVRVSTPLDGRVTLTLRVPRGAVYELRLAGQPVKRVSGPGRVRASTTACGNRQVGAAVRKVSGRGAFQLVISLP